MREKLKDQDLFWLEKVKISEVSEFSILPYTQKWTEFKGQDMLLEEKHFRGSKFEVKEYFPRFPSFRFWV